MTTITRKDIAELVLFRLHEQLVDVSKYKVEQQTALFFQVMGQWVVNGDQVRISRHGWICAKFKPGGRPVRNPKNGDVMVMPDTYSVRLTKKRHGLDDSKKINANEITFMMKDWGVLPKISEEIYQALLHFINDGVMGMGDRIELRGFGVFSKRTQEARQSRNPKTGERVDLEERTMLRFKGSRSLVKRLEATH